MRGFETSIQWLADAGLLHKVSRIAKPFVPLKAYVDFPSFKLFESMVQRDLSVYAESIGAATYFFRDNVTGLDVDSIIQFEDGEFVAVEIKLGASQFEDAKRNQVRFSSLCAAKPAFCACIAGIADCIAQDKESGAWLLPATSLRG